MDGWNTTFLLGWPIFRGYVSFRESKVHIKMHDEKLQASTLGSETSITKDEHMGSECLGFIGDYTTQLWGDCNKPL